MNDNRRKLTGILKLLYENTDSEHSMDTYQIMDTSKAWVTEGPTVRPIDANIKLSYRRSGIRDHEGEGKPNRYRWIEENLIF